MRNMVTLGEPIVLHRTLTSCDGCGAEYVTITDGHFAYAYTDGADIPTLAQHTVQPVTRIHAACARVNLVSGENCHGEVTVDLSATGWSATPPEALHLLNRFGTPIERD